MALVKRRIQSVPAYSFDTMGGPMTLSGTAADVEALGKLVDVTVNTGFKYSPAVTPITLKT